MDKSPVNLFWWPGKDNFKNLGDEITGIIMSRLFSQPIRWTPYRSAEMIGTGSILGWAFEREDMRYREKSLTVLGSGLMHPWSPVSAQSCADIRLVRGYLTRTTLSRVLNKHVPVGDPGLLASDAMDTKETDKKYRYGIIPHFSQTDNPNFRDKFRKLPDSVFIDFRTDNFDEIAGLMLKCDTIISQGLHGLIFADSFMLPNVWLKVGDLHKSGDFKFFDYFSSIGRPFFKFVDFSSLSERLIEKNVHLPDPAILRDIKSDIRGAFADYLSCRI